MAYRKEDAVTRFLCAVCFLAVLLVGGKLAFADGACDGEIIDNGDGTWKLDCSGGDCSAVGGTCKKRTVQFTGGATWTCECLVWNKELEIYEWQANALCLTELSIVICQHGIFYYPGCEPISCANPCVMAGDYILQDGGEHDGALDTGTPRCECP